LIRRLVTFALLLVLVPYVLRQARKPDRWAGRLFVWLMNRSHAGLMRWGLAHVAVRPDATILDVGCGGGTAVEAMAAVAPQGRVCGIDYAAGSVAAARARNARAIREGRVEIRTAEVSRLPYEAATFDLVTAFETHYYWPDLPADVREILRVLKPGGELAIVAEAYRRQGALNAVEQVGMQLVRGAHLSAGEHRQLLEQAGYEGVQVDEEPRRGWICVTGRRAGAATAVVSSGGMSRGRPVNTPESPY